MNVLSIDELLNDLTQPQRAAAAHVDGPLLIIAGAGSGKTRVLTRRVAHLVACGIPQSSILAITFTNKAAGEMKERVGKLMGHPFRDIGRLDQWYPMICTFHSLCLRILRHYNQRLGVPASFTIYDSQDQSKVIKEALKLLEISSGNFSPSQVHGAISNLKNQLVTPESYAASASAFYERNIARIYGKYQKFLEKNQALDFDDLLMKTVHGLRDHPDVLGELQDRFQYILIDEYQDTNHAQYVLAHALAMRDRNICVVGDPDQSIYAWRGADIQNILDFENDYKDATTVRLEQNYRSTKTILSLASELIARNSRRKEKGLWTENAEGDKAQYVICQNETDEASVVVELLKEEHEKNGRPWNEMAIFYRMNSLSRLIEEKLMAGRIPYQIARGVEFYNRKEIKDVLSYLRVLANPNDEISLERVINTPTRGISDESVRKMQVWGVAQGLTLWEAMARVDQVTGLNTRAVKSVQAFHSMMDSLRRKILASENRTPPTGEELDAANPASDEPGNLMFETAKAGVQAIMQDLVEKSGMQAALNKSTDPDKPELANVKELINSASQYDREHPEGRLEDYLSQISLMSDVDKVKDGGGVVTLMTLHAAKGLEFPMVVMIGMEEGLLPHSRAKEDADQYEEERRLCFVGITRAQQKVIFTRAFSRTLMGRSERTVPSPFIREMPSELIVTVDRMEQGLIASDSDEFDDSLFHRGQMVRHAQFGIGRIADIQHMGRHTRAIVDFQKSGKKTLILEYAQLEPMG